MTVRNVKDNFLSFPVNFLIVVPFSLIFVTVQWKTKMSRMEWQCQTPDKSQHGTPNSSRLSVVRCLLVGVINRYRPRTSGGTRGALISTRAGKNPDMGTATTVATPAARCRCCCCIFLAIIRGTGDCRKLTLAKQCQDLLGGVSVVCLVVGLLVATLASACATRSQNMQNRRPKQRLCSLWLWIRLQRCMKRFKPSIISHGLAKKFLFHAEKKRTKIECH